MTAAPLVSTSPPPRVRHRRRPALDTPSSSRVWLISFTDIMGLMLTFFVMAYAMSDHQIQRFDDNAATDVKRPASFQGPSGQTGASDVITLPRRQQTAALDPAYLSGVLARKEKDTPELHGLMIAPSSQGGLILSIPLEKMMTPQTGAIPRSGRVVLREIVDLLKGTPNRMVIAVDPPAGAARAQAVPIALAQARLLLQNLRAEGIKNDIGLMVEAQASTNAKPFLRLYITPFGSAKTLD